LGQTRIPRLDGAEQGQSSTSKPFPDYSVPRGLFLASLAVSFVMGTQQPRADTPEPGRSSHGLGGVVEMT
uniref:Uncharacterized protein n=1 Tax=Serinus canaria TaxID=9135 RepID=A0A8C9NHM5_SERCA